MGMNVPVVIILLSADKDLEDKIYCTKSRVLPSL